MKTFFTSDTHFFHSRIIQYCLRPFADVNEMNETLIANWNNVVTPDDVVYHLGDFAFGDANGVDQVMRRLNFKHFHFVKGNHDKPFCDWYHSNKDDTYLAPKVSLYQSHLETKIEGHKFTLCHYAMRIWNESHRGALHLYGHSHGTLPDDCNSKSFDVGVDCHDFAPISLERVLHLMSKKKMEQKFENLPGVKAGIIRE
jgi:calcineurin-like phosphoesterase family protein